MKLLYQWTVSLPLLACLLFFSGYIYENVTFQIIAGFLLIGSVMSAVHHSEIIAHRVGEPYGTIILAVAITIIEVSVIVSLMISGGEESVSLARDTVYAATMLILNGIVGLCLFIGGLKHHEQTFSKHSVTIALVSLVSIIMFTLILPTFTKSISGPYYSSSQMIFASVACLLIYVSFIFAQTVRHREYFLTDEKNTQQIIKPFITKRSLITSAVFLLVSLSIVVLLAKTLSPSIEEIIVSYNLPKTLVGIVIASIILLPEGIAAIIAARKNKLQTSLNLALGSALASIGLTIPVVSIVCHFYNIQIILGLDYLSIILLMLSVLTVMLSLNSGRSNIVYGTVLLVNLMAFVYLIVYP
ncbi:calcium/proton antiporter [Sporocytophaga myxococcoides]|uniref:Calcium/proton antiporter n=1 Tax=Sporocytophaga myxococcoides TaxID=153721 RepID=A0A098LMQ2_9BACT|nr:ionic transporter y4hA [Sporocytophaga myxococcoides]GAL87388.1 calcium/proton antiporter [Sporocytophaga myxococcoides]